MEPGGAIVVLTGAGISAESGLPTFRGSAGLWLGQTDEREMGFTYDELERYVVTGADAVGEEARERIERLARLSEHKRVLPPAPGIKVP